VNTGGKPTGVVVSAETPVGSLSALFSSQNKEKFKRVKAPTAQSVMSKSNDTGVAGKSETGAGAKNSKKKTKAKNKRKRDSSDGAAGTTYAGESAAEGQTGSNSPSETQDNVQDRTIFVGNIALTTTAKALKKVFKEYGTVEAVRMRSQPVVSCLACNCKSGLPCLTAT
jgi:RNA recognition motif-containing protein